MRSKLRTKWLGHKRKGLIPADMCFSDWKHLYYNEDCNMFDLGPYTPCAPACEASAQVNFINIKEKRPGMFIDGSLSTEANQKEYLSGRVREVALKKYEDLLRTHGLKDDPQPITPKELVDRIKAGQYVLPENSDDRDFYHYLLPAHFIIWRNPEIKKDQENFNKAEAAMIVEKTKVLDTIMVSNAADGLKALQEFEAKDFGPPF